MRFDPTQKESDKMRELFFSMGNVYANLIKYFPIIDQVINELPDTSNVDRILDIFRPMLSDALCRVRGLPDGSIKELDIPWTLWP